MLTFRAQLKRRQTNGPVRPVSGNITYSILMAIIGCFLFGNATVGESVHVAVQKKVQADKRAAVAKLFQTCGLPDAQDNWVFGSITVLSDQNLSSISNCSEEITKLHYSFNASLQLTTELLAPFECSQSEKWEILTEYEKLFLYLASKIDDMQKWTSSWTGASWYRKFSEQLVSMRLRSVAMAADVTLSIGDLALKSRCLDIADERYRHVLQAYTQGFVASHRERAQVGIDDVRAKRSGILCRLFGYC